MSAFTDQFTEDPADPLSALFKFLWLRFDEELTLSELVKVGNRITFTDRQRIVKANISEGDVPEVMLTFPTVLPKGVDSGNDALVVTCRWTVTTGTQLFYNSITSPVWYLICMLMKIEGEGSQENLGLPNLILEGIKFPAGIPFGYMDLALNRGMIGYASNIDFEATLIYNRMGAYNV